MRYALLAVAMCALGLSIIGVAPAPGHRDDTDSAYERAHQAAVKYRLERDHLQHLLTRRVLEARDLRRSLVRRPSSLQALRLAAVAYGVDFRLLYRIASCESTGTDPDHSPTSERSLKADAKNPSSTARGLGQFLDSSWAATPFGGFDVNDPYAAALAMGNEIRLGHTGWQWAASAGCWK